MVYFLSSTDFFQFLDLDAYREEEHFLIFLMLMGALFFAIAVVVGVVLCLIFAVLIIALISAGLLSASVLVGYQNKSVSAGFKTFIVLASTLGTTVASTIFFRILNSIYHYSSHANSIIIGVLVGIITGFLLGLIVFQALKRIVIFVNNKYKNYKAK